MLLTMPQRSASGLESVHAKLQTPTQENGSSFYPLGSVARFRDAWQCSSKG